jgi:hypothetical protein
MMIARLTDKRPRKPQKNLKKSLSKYLMTQVYVVTQNSYPQVYYFIQNKNTPYGGVFVTSR